MVYKTLIVDDYVGTISMMEKVLKHYDDLKILKIYTANSVEGARKIVEEEKSIDIAIMDTNIGSENGIKFYESIREKINYAIGMSGNPAGDDWKNAGAQDFMKKPIDLDILDAIIEAAKKYLTKTPSET